MTGKSSQFSSGQLRVRGQAFMDRYGHWIPWVSLVWGVGSAFVISRNLASPARFLLAGAALIALVLVFEILVFRKGRRGQQWIDFVYALMTQNATQYTILFVLPFLALGRQWTALIMSLPVCALCLWDPWWMKAHRNPHLMLLVQQWVAALVTTAFFTSFAPRFLVATGWVLGLILLLVSAASLRQAALSGRHARGALVGLGILGLVFPGMAVWQQINHSVVPFPLVGTWLLDPAFTAGRPHFEGRERIVAPLNSLTFGGRQDRELCCVTPIIAAPGFRATLEHEWKVGDVVLDVIPLPEVTGNGQDASFRTFSCKQNLPELGEGDVVRCTVRVRRGPAIGLVTLAAIKH